MVAPSSTPVLTREQAAEWATWFAALGDPTRVLMLHLLASAERPLTVAEITERLDVGQSTVSHHLAKLAEVRFVLVDRVGTSSLWRVNQDCIRCFPSAADVVMGRIDSDFVDAVASTDQHRPARGHHTKGGHR
jgi:DNA-binding transcriptional ArsR family regulator